VVFLYIACSLDLYKWIVTAIRIHFFGGMISLNVYTKRTRITRTNYIVLASAISAGNMAAIAVDASGT
jgi:hypothetical protein